MNRLRPSFLILLLALLGITACEAPKTADGVKRERGPGGTVAYWVDIEASEPGVRIEADGNYVGTTPVKVKIFGDKDGTFHSFGNPEYVISAIPNRQGQYTQTKAFGTGNWFGREDRIPERIYFDMNLVPFGAAAGGPAQPLPPMVPGGGGSVRYSGTGFFVTKDGYLLTNHHVVDRANEVKVKFRDKIYPAKVVRVDIGADLAVLKVEGEFEPLKFLDSRNVKLGEAIFTIGFPRPGIQGQEPKFTDGTISSLYGISDDAGEFQISAPIQPGNSGGPLVNSAGQVVGIVVSKLRGGENVNYAVKSNRARILFEDVPAVSFGDAAPGSPLRSDQVAEILAKSAAMVLAY